MNARKAVREFGQALIGKHIWTERYGEYPGGIATVVELEPDPNAPEIVLEVQHLSWRTKEHHDGKIGVFEHEYIALIE